MKTFWETIEVAFGMFSRVPVRSIEWTPQNRKYSMLAFPLVGVVLGSVWFLVAYFGNAFGFPSLLTGALLTGVPLLVVGGIPLDGYADTTDALASHGDQETKLSIMKDPHVGSFAVIHLVVYLLLWFAASVSLAETDLEVWILTGLVFVLSRTLSGLAVTTFPMAKDTGLAKSFADEADKKRVRNGLIAVFAVLVVLLLVLDFLFATLPGGLCMLVAAAILFFWYRYIAKKHFDGMTGDLAGWFLCRAELWMLVAAAVAWQL